MLDAECKPIGIMQQRSQIGFGGVGGEGVLFPNYLLVRQLLAVPSHPTPIAKRLPQKQEAWC